MNKWEWMISVFCLFFCGALILHYFQNFKSYDLGVQLLEQKLYEPARQEFLNILVKKPFFFPARLNLALTESLQENFKSAFEEYQLVAGESSHKKERFQAQFNSAHLKNHLGDMEFALQYYQQALKENPESIEVKTNIELMMKNQQSLQQSSSQNDSEKQKHENQGKDSQQEIQEESQQQKDESVEKEELNSDQVQFILKELENREQELKSRLQNKKKYKKGKPW